MFAGAITGRAAVRPPATASATRYRSPPATRADNVDHARTHTGGVTGMEPEVRLRDGDWERAFDRLNDRGGGTIYVEAGVHHATPVTIDLGRYPRLRNNVSIRGAGLGASTIHLGNGPGDGFTIKNSGDQDVFYLELTGVQFRGNRDGVLFRLGADDFADAYNSCTLRFATNNGSPEGEAACRLNHVLNSEHFGVHNADGGTALDLGRFQFGGITGSTSSRRGVSLHFGGYSLANVVEWLNVEACADGVRIGGGDCNINRVGMLYGADVSGVLWRHEADVESRIDAAFVGDDVATIDRRAAGSYTVGMSNRTFDHASPGARRDD